LSLTWEVLENEKGKLKDFKSCDINIIKKDMKKRNVIERDIIKRLKDNNLVNVYISESI
jgi:hypothetical protein